MAQDFSNLKLFIFSHLALHSIFILEFRRMRFRYGLRLHLHSKHKNFSKLCINFLHQNRWNSATWASKSEACGKLRTSRQPSYLYVLSKISSSSAHYKIHQNRDLLGDWILTIWTFLYQVNCTPWLHVSEVTYIKMYGLEDIKLSEVDCFRS